MKNLTSPRHLSTVAAPKSHSRRNSAPGPQPLAPPPQLSVVSRLIVPSAAVVFVPPHILQLTTSSSVASYTFSSILSPSSTQSDLFEEVGTKILAQVKSGQKTCVFSYGGRGSGKSYSLIGRGGLVPAMTTELSLSGNVQLKMLEVHRGKVRKLIETGKTVAEVIRGGYSKRAVSAAGHSLSHIVIKVKSLSSGGSACFVDLASPHRELLDTPLYTLDYKAIVSSLAEVGEVLGSLSTTGQARTAHTQFPRLLKEYLKPDVKITVLVHVDDRGAEETQQILRFSQEIQGVSEVKETQLAGRTLLEQRKNEQLAEIQALTGRIQGVQKEMTRLCGKERGLDRKEQLSELLFVPGPSQKGLKREIEELSQNLQDSRVSLKTIETEIYRKNSSAHNKENAGSAQDLRKNVYKLLKLSLSKHLKETIQDNQAKQTRQLEEILALYMEANATLSESLRDQPDTAVSPSLSIAHSPLSQSSRISNSLCASTGFPSTKQKKLEEEASSVRQATALISQQVMLLKSENREISAEIQQFALKLRNSIPL